MARPTTRLPRSFAATWPANGQAMRSIPPTSWPPPGPCIPSAGSAWAASRPYVAGIEAPRQADIRSALDDCPAIREDGHLIGAGQETQGELVSAHLPQRQQRRLKLRQVQRPRALMDLYRVTAAQAHRRAP